MAGVVVVSCTPGTRSGLASRGWSHCCFTGSDVSPLPGLPLFGSGAGVGDGWPLRCGDRAFGLMTSAEGTEGVGVVPARGSAPADAEGDLEG